MSALPLRIPRGGEAVSTGRASVGTGPTSDTLLALRNAVMTSASGSGPSNEPATAHQAQHLSDPLAVEDWSCLKLARFRFPKLGLSLAPVQLSTSMPSAVQNT